MANHPKMRFPGGRDRALTFSYDDGVIQDMRLVEILNKHGMKGTFNLNSGLYKPEDEKSSNRRMTESQVTALFADSPHEVACHSYTHPSLAEMPIGCAAYEMIKDRETLEAQFGKIVRGMAYPYGTVNDEVVDMLKACGIVYGRTVVSTEKFNLPTDWLRMPATCHHKNPRLMELAEQFVDMKVKLEPKLFYLWGHTYEFDDNDNWNVIEKFTEFMSGREEQIWYATNMEIYEYIHDYEQLIWSVNGSMVTNPTNRTLWFVMNGVTYSIAPGETLRLF